MHASIARAAADGCDRSAWRRCAASVRARCGRRGRFAGSAMCGESRRTAFAEVRSPLSRASRPRISRAREASGIFRRKGRVKEDRCMIAVANERSRRSPSQCMRADPLIRLSAYPFIRLSVYPFIRANAQTRKRANAQTRPRPRELACSRAHAEARPQAPARAPSAALFRWNRHVISTATLARPAASPHHNPRAPRPAWNANQ